MELAGGKITFLALHLAINLNISISFFVLAFIGEGHEITTLAVTN